ncbi:MAG: hypothetical protein ACE5IJ_02170 [Thermoplasmata archaeon]
MIEEVQKVLEHFEAHSRNGFSFLTSFENREFLLPTLVQLGYRTMDLWAAMGRANESTTLSCVPPRYRSELVHAKNLTTLITVISDDAADSSKDRGILEKVAGIVMAKLENNPVVFDASDPHLMLVASSWDEVVSILESAPRFEEFRDLLLFDMGELMQCQRFNLVINMNPLLCNTDEYLAYGTHNFNVKPHMTMDLMFSRDFRREDLAPFRRALHHIQTAIQLVNDVHTMDREIMDEGSFGNYSMIWGLEKGRISIDDVYQMRASKIRKAFPLRDFEKKWKRHMGMARELLSRTNSFDVNDFLESVLAIRKMYEVASGRM